MNLGNFFKVSEENLQFWHFNFRMLMASEKLETGCTLYFRILVDIAFMLMRKNQMAFNHIVKNTRWAIQAHWASCLKCGLMISSHLPMTGEIKLWVESILPYLYSSGINKVESFEIFENNHLVNKCYFSWNWFDSVFVSNFTVMNEWLNFA